MLCRPAQADGHFISKKAADSGMFRACDNDVHWCKDLCFSVPAQVQGISFLRDGQRRAPGQVRAWDLALVHAPGSAKAPSVSDSMSALGIYALDRAGRQLPGGPAQTGVACSDRNIRANDCF